MYSLGCILTTLDLHVQIPSLDLGEVPVADQSDIAARGDLIADPPDLLLLAGS